MAGQEALSGGPGTERGNPWRGGAGGSVAGQLEGREEGEVEGQEGEEGEVEGQEGGSEQGLVVISGPAM